MVHPSFLRDVALYLNHEDVLSLVCVNSQFHNYIIDNRRYLPKMDITLKIENRNDNNLFVSFKPNNLLDYLRSINKDNDDGTSKQYDIEISEATMTYKTYRTPAFLYYSLQGSAPVCQFNIDILDSPGKSVLNNVTLHKINDRSHGLEMIIGAIASKFSINHLKMVGDDLTDTELEIIKRLIKPHYTIKYTTSSICKCKGDCVCKCNIKDYFDTCKCCKTISSWRTKLEFDTNQYNPLHMDIANSLRPESIDINWRSDQIFNLKNLSLSNEIRIFALKWDPEMIMTYLKDWKLSNWYIRGVCIIRADELDKYFIPLWNSNFEKLLELLDVKHVEENQWDQEVKEFYFTRGITGTLCIQHSVKYGYLRIYQEETEPD